jgi:hypothetical protein
VRINPTDIPSWILLAEGISQDRLANGVRAALADDWPRAHGAGAAPRLGI